MRQGPGDDVVAFRIEDMHRMQRSGAGFVTKADQNETEKQLSAFLADPQWLHIAMPIDLPGGGEACNALERALYPPGTSSNDLFHMRAISTESTPWVLISVPFGDKQFAVNCLAEQGLVLEETHPSTRPKGGNSMDELLMPVPPGHFFIALPQRGVTPFGRSLHEMGPDGASQLAEHVAMESLSDFVSRQGRAGAVSASVPRSFSKGDHLVEAIDGISSWSPQRSGKPGKGTPVTRNDQLLVCDNIIEWLEAAAHNPQPQKPAGSAFHKLVEALGTNNLFGFESDLEREARALGAIHDQVRIFLIEHDWAGALARAEEFAGSDDFVLPYDYCCFEMRMNGRRQCILMCSHRPDRFSVFVQCDEQRWFALGTGSWTGPGGSLMRQLIYSQIRAICIALEAEVAVTQVEPAPVKLNASRAKKGKALLKDFHVVRLKSRKPRPEPRERGEPTGRRHRLHFRRGHWRHYEMAETACEHHWGRDDGPDKRSHCQRCAGWRIRIKWTLAGDPDLGFIDKHYRL